VRSEAIHSMNVRAVALAAEIMDSLGTSENDVLKSEYLPKIALAASKGRTRFEFPRESLKRYLK